MMEPELWFPANTGFISFSNVHRSSISFLITEVQFTSYPEHARSSNVDIKWPEKSARLLKL
jgi:hypothetical protein